MKTVFFTVADDQHLKWAENLKTSFHKFHPDIEFKIYSGKYVKKWLKAYEEGILKEYSEALWLNHCGWPGPPSV